jgi:LPS export ABC transporter protein LptC
MRLYLQNSFLFQLFIFIIILAVAVGGCGKSEVVPKKLKDTLDVSQIPDQKSWDVEVLFFDSSRTKAVLQANRARIYNDRMETLLDGGLKVEFMSKETGRRVSVLTADSARIDDKTRDMLARGNVVVVSDSTGTRLETELLEWNNETRKLYSTEFVTITTPSERLQGYGFESDQTLTNYTIKRVRGEQR